MNARSSVAVGIALAAALSVAGATAGVAIAEPASRPQAYQQGRPATPAPAPAQPPATRGTSTITVSVVADDGTAVKRATVMLVAVPAARTAPGQPGAQLLVDDAPSVAEFILKNPAGLSQVDFILDNIGLELAYDLLLADFLLERGELLRVVEGRLAVGHE